MQASRVNFTKPFGINLRTLNCKLDLFIEMQQILVSFMKCSSLPQSVSKLMSKLFYEIDIWSLNGQQKLTESSK